MDDFPFPSQEAFLQRLAEFIDSINEPVLDAVILPDDNEPSP
jgi:hypothetical protein